MTTKYKNTNHEFDYVDVCELCPLWDFERGCIRSNFAMQVGSSFSYLECNRYYLLRLSINRAKAQIKREAEQEYLNSLKQGELF